MAPRDTGHSKILLDESEMPTRWYNLVADLPKPPPPALHPGTHEPAGPDDFASLFRARRQEAPLETPARIYCKFEGVSPAESHQPDTSVPEASYNHQEGITKLNTETGAGQWGGVAASYRSTPQRRTMMQLWRATVHFSPSQVTDCRRSLLAQDPDQPGSLGIAISETVGLAVADPGRVPPSAGC